MNIHIYYAIWIEGSDELPQILYRIHQTEITAPTPPEPIFITHI